jgi:PPE-repeat protein
VLSAPAGPTAGGGGAAAGWYPPAQFAGLGGGLSGGGGSPAVSASAGHSGTIGRLSVPSSWAVAPSELEAASPGLLQAHAASSAHPGTGGLLRGIPLTGTGVGRRAGGFIHRYGFRHAVMPRPPSAG